MATSNLVIGFDADDTLWHNETIFEGVHERYYALLAQHHDAMTVERTLYATEMRNLEAYGYGIKGFTLSAIETAIELTGGQISAEEIRELIRLGQEMLAHPVNLIEGVGPVLKGLAAHHTLILITKGDLRDQERKIAKSGLGTLFCEIEVVSEKDQATYAQLLKRHQVAATDFLMVGNSAKSDILPVLALGAFAAHIPYHITWEAERAAQAPEASGRFFELKSVSELPDLVARIEQARASSSL